MCAPVVLWHLGAILSFHYCHCGDICLPCVACLPVLQQYVPLFLTKEDLDVAVSGAYRQRNAAQISAVKDKVWQLREPWHPCCAAHIAPHRHILPRHRLTLCCTVNSAVVYPLHPTVCTLAYCTAPVLYYPCTGSYRTGLHCITPKSQRCVCLLQAAQFEAEYQTVMREADEAKGRDKSSLEAKAGKVSIHCILLSYGKEGSSGISHRRHDGVGDAAVCVLIGGSMHFVAHGTLWVPSHKVSPTRMVLQVQCVHVYRSRRSWMMHSPRSQRSRWLLCQRWR